MIAEQPPTEDIDVPPRGNVTRWLAYLDRAIACCEAVFLSATVKIADDPDASLSLFSSCLLARSVSNARAVQKLIEAGLVVEARTIVRCIFENEFYIYALVKEGKSFLDRMLDDEMFFRASRGQTVLDGPTTREGMGEEARERLKAFLKEIRADRKKPIKPRDVIKGYDISEAYIFYQSLSGDAAHPSVTALNRHVVEGPNTTIRALMLVPPVRVDEVLDTAFLAAMALLGVAIAANQIFGGTTGGEQLEALVPEYQALAKATLSEAPTPA